MYNTIVKEQSESLQLYSKKRVMPFTDIHKEYSLRKHLRVYESLHSQIMSGQYQPGQQFPTLDVLSNAFAVSRPTVVKAMDLLEQKGLISRRRGGGVFVHENVAPVKKVKPIGLLLPDQVVEENTRTESVFKSMIPRLMAYAKERRLFLVVNSYASNEQNILKDMQYAFDSFAQQNVSGVIFQYCVQKDTDELNQRVLELLENADKPVVLLDHDVVRYPQRSRFDVVSINNERAGYVVTSHLVEAGATSICYVNVDFQTNSPVSSERFYGFQNALLKHGLEPHSILTIPYKSHAEAHEVLIRQIRAKNIDAIVCENDSVASQCMYYLLSAGMRIPDDIRIVGFDDLSSSGMLPVPLTTISQPIDEMASEAVSLIADRLSNPRRPAREIMLTESLVVRQSSGAIQKPI